MASVGAVSEAVGLDLWWVGVGRGGKVMQQRGDKRESENEYEVMCINSEPPPHALRKEMR